MVRPDMPLECPRCLLTNPDTTYICECGYDLIAQMQRQPGSTGNTRGSDYGMSKEGFLLGIFVVWFLLIFAEWSRMRPELKTRTTFNLLTDSLMLSLTDMAGALIIGALGWAVVWVILAYEGRRLRPCPRRTTLGVTVVAAGLLYLTRWIAPDIEMQHIVQAVVVLSVAVFAYYAGTRQWLGKW